MRNLLWATVLVAGCGAQSTGFQPPPPAADEIQVLSPQVTIQPGENITYCSYLAVSIPTTIDVIASHGLQSAGGHHAILYAARQVRPLDTHVCTEDDMLNVRYLAGVGAEGATSLDKLPAGVAFRIPANAPMMIQTHWINATPSVVKGQAAINLQTAPVSADRVPADLFSVVDLKFNIPAGKVGSSTSTCTVPEDVSMFYLGGHEHEWGTHFRAEQVSTSGALTTLYEKDWQQEFEFNPPVNTYTRENPLVVKKGEGIKISCTWDNTTGAKDLTFPTDMCVAFAFYFPGHGEIDCVDGQWPTN